MLKKEQGISFMGKYFNVRQLDTTDCTAACLVTVSFCYGYFNNESKHFW